MHADADDIEAAVLGPARGAAANAANLRRAEGQFKRRRLERDAARAALRAEAGLGTSFERDVLNKHIFKHITSPPVAIITDNNE